MEEYATATFVEHFGISVYVLLLAVLVHYSMLLPQSTSKLEGSITRDNLSTKHTRTHSSHKNVLVCTGDWSAERWRPWWRRSRRTLNDFSESCYVYPGSHMSNAQPN